MDHLSEEAVIGEECIFPRDFLQLYNNTKVENSSEALTVLLHAFMVEVNFVPKCNDGCVSSNSMPENWKTSSIFKIRYSHKSCPDASCWMTCVPLYSTLVVHGVIDNIKDYGSTSIELQIDSYIQSQNATDFTKSSEFFHNMRELSRLFKDDFCFPLLILLHESVGNKDIFGLSGLLTELKISILRLLPVEDVISLSAVNKSFNKLVNSPVLWKFLYHRDFGTGVVDDSTGSDEKNTWKIRYKKEYLKKKRRIASHPPLYHPYHMPVIFPVGPDYNVDLNIGLDPILQQTFPMLRSRFTPSNLFFPMRPHPAFGRFF